VALLLDPWGGLPQGAARICRLLLVTALAGHALFVLAEGHLAPRPREREYRRALRLVTHGPWARRRWAIGVGCGIALAALSALALAPAWGGAAAGLLALVGLWVEDDVLVRAGQAAPIS
jgi:hypothetical protein